MQNLQYHSIDHTVPQFFSCLDSLTSAATKEDQSSLETMIRSFFAIIENRSKENRDLMAVSLGEVDSFFAKKQMQISPYIQETHRKTFEIYQHVMHFCDHHLSHASLCLRTELKIKMANLPSSQPRRNFQNLYLTKCEQVKYLIDYFQRLENQTIHRLLENKLFYLSARDMKCLIKLVQTKSNLSKDNLVKLRYRILVSYSLETLPWDDDIALKKALLPLALFDSKRNQTKEEHLESLKRIAKAKIFFLKQESSKEEEIQIPRWFHMTKCENMEKICQSGEIKVSHDRGSYEGAWVSTKPEICYGTFGFALDDSIEKIVERPSIYTLPWNARWRGLQQPIPLKICFAIIPSDVSKEQQKEYKKKIYTWLGESHGSRIVLSLKQAECLKNGIFDAVGVPNLSSSWWGGETLKRKR